MSFIETLAYFLKMRLSHELNLTKPLLERVHPEMVDCGSDQGRSEVETAGVAALRRGFQPSENAELGHKMPFMDGH